ncbi:MAG: hypothetical protein L0206_06160 [Actinobacteria bacterium]|nr:hypothetical protein [Actinomycetota bacterium]
MRVLAGLGLLVALVWVIPLVFLSREQAERAAELRGAAPTAPTGVTAGVPVEPTEPTGATGGVLGPTGATGGPAGPTGATGGPAGPIGQANDLEAQATLNDTIRIARLYAAENGSFEGFTPEVAAGFDPSIAYTEGVPVPDTVAIVVTPTAVVLVTVVDGGGGYLCIAANGEVLTTGRVNATTPEQCQGGWQ